MMGTAANDLGKRVRVHCARGVSVYSFEFCIAHRNARLTAIRWARVQWLDNLLYVCIFMDLLNLFGAERQFEWPG